MIEFRCLIFSEQETAIAIIERRRKNKEPLPSGTFKDILLSGKHEISAFFRIIDDYGKIHTTVISEQELAAAVIAYCMNKKIPLPMGVSKRLEIVKNELVLIYDMKYNFDKKQTVKAVADKKSIKLFSKD